MLIFVLSNYSIWFYVISIFFFFQICLFSIFVICHLRFEIMSGFMHCIGFWIYCCEFQTFLFLLNVFIFTGDWAHIISIIIDRNLSCPALIFVRKVFPGEVHRNKCYLLLLFNIFMYFMHFSCFELKRVFQRDYNGLWSGFTKFNFWIDLIRINLIKIYFIYRNFQMNFIM